MKLTTIIISSNREKRLELSSGERAIFKIEKINLNKKKQWMIKT